MLYGFVDGALGRFLLLHGASRVRTRRLQRQPTRADHVLNELRTLGEGHGFELYAEEPEMAVALGAEHLPISEFGKKVDVALALGGDGTVLYTARALHGSDVPIMGINLGSLGFLATPGWSGQPGQSGQSGQSGLSGQSG